MKQKKMLSANLHFVLWICLVPALLFSVGFKKIVMKPMQPRTLIIEDGEYLQYGEYASGEKTRDSYVVSRISQDKKILTIYREEIEIGKNFHTLPKNYTNFTRKFIIDLQTASLVYDKEDCSNCYFWALSNNIQGSCGSELMIDRVKSVANFQEKIYDGYELRDKISRIPIKPDYPV